MDAELFSLKLVVRSLFAITLVAMMISMVHAQPPTPLWIDPTVETADIELSKDGNYVVVASSLIGDGLGGQVRFYSRSSGTPLWTWSSGAFFSVAISEHGEYVAAGGYVGDQDYYVFYWKNARTLTGTPDPDWTSSDLYGPIWGRCLDMSNDGNYIVAGGTGESVFYWADARTAGPSPVSPAWTYSFPSGGVEAVDLSGDGNYVVAGLSTSQGSPGVAYWKGAWTLTGSPQPNWASSEADEVVPDVAVSDDGNYVAASALLGSGGVYYWAEAKTLSGDPLSSWKSAGLEFMSVDISCDGDSVVAGVEGFEVYFWSGARRLTGSPTPSWVYPTDNLIGDVAINDAGTYMAAVDFPIDTVYFFNRQGNLLWQDQAISGDKLSISCDGGTLAVGTPVIQIGTAYLLDTGYSSPCCGAAVPVGGVVANLEESAVLAPYLAFTVIIGAAAVVVVFAKRRKA